MACYMLLLSVQNLWYKYIRIIGKKVKSITNPTHQKRLKDIFGLKKTPKLQITPPKNGTKDVSFFAIAAFINLIQFERPSSEPNIIKTTENIMITTFSQLLAYNAHIKRQIIVG